MYVMNFDPDGSMGAILVVAKSPVTQCSLFPQPTLI